MDKLKQAWAMTSTPMKAALVLAGLLALAMISGGVWVWRDQIHDARFDRARVAEAEARAADAEESAKAKGRAEAAESRAANSEAKVEIMETAISAAGARVQEASRKLTEEDERYAEALKNSGSDSLNACERWKHNCETAKRLGIKPKAEPCECKDGGGSR